MSTPTTLSFILAAGCPMTSSLLAEELDLGEREGRICRRGIRGRHDDLHLRHQPAVLQIHMLAVDDLDAADRRNTAVGKRRAELLLLAVGELERDHDIFRA